MILTPSHDVINVIQQQPPTVTLAMYTAPRQGSADEVYTVHTTMDHMSLGRAKNNREIMENQ